MRTIIMLAVLVPTVGAEPSAQSGGVSRRLCQWLGVTHASLTARSPRAIPKVGACPSGWSDVGSYCVEVQRPPH